MARALLLNLLDAPLERGLALLRRLQLSPQRLLGGARLALARLELADAVAEEVVDELHLAHARLERRVLRGEAVVAQRGLEVRAVDRRRRARRGLAEAEAVLEDGVAAQRLLEHVLRGDVGGMRKVGGPRARDGRLRAVREARRDLARGAAVLRESELAVGIRVGGGEAVDALNLVSQTSSAVAGDHAHLLASGPARLDAVAALDDIRLERDGARAAVQLQEQPAGVAQHGARLIAAPERRRARRAVLADRLWPLVSTALGQSDEMLSIVDKDKSKIYPARQPGHHHNKQSRRSEERNVPASCPVRQRLRAQRSRRSC